MTRSPDFFFPHHRYAGAFHPQDMVFNANLQEFAQRVGYIASLQTGGKLSSCTAVAQIRELWEMLERNHTELDIG